MPVTHTDLELTVNGKKRTDIVACLKSENDKKHIILHCCDYVTIKNEKFDNIFISNSEISPIKFINCEFSRLHLDNVKCEELHFDNCIISNLELDNCSVKKINIKNITSQIHNISFTTSDIYSLSVIECKEILRFRIKECNITELDIYKTCGSIDIIISFCKFKNIYFNKNSNVTFQISETYSKTFYVRDNHFAKLIMNSNHLTECGEIYENSISDLYISKNYMSRIAFSDLLPPYPIMNIRENTFISCTLPKRFTFEINNNIMVKCVNKDNSKFSIFSSMKILPEGDIIGWKKCRNNKIVKLRIPAHAQRSNYHRKCRASEVEVLGIYTYDKAYKILAETNDFTFATSLYNESFTYNIGDIKKSEYPFDENESQECASGIHFFITKEEAIQYVF